MKMNDKYSATLTGVNQEDINRFGALHGTTGRTHTDPEYAKLHFGGVIVQGGLVMAPVLDIFESLLGAHWYEASDMDAKFVAITRPGDIVNVTLEVVERDAESIKIAYSCALQDGKVVQVGEVRHRFKASENAN